MNRLILIILSTFIIGLVFGVSVYLMSSTADRPLQEPDGVGGDSFEIIVKAYGGCQMAGLRCASYQIVTSGAYTYLSGGPQGDQQRFSGTVAKSDQTTLLAAIRNTDFRAIINSEASEACPAAYDGIAYSYEIRYAGSQYEIDSCVEDVSGEPLFSLLDRYFATFATVHSQ